MNRQRAVRQMLEDLRSAGVTHVPADFARELATALQTAPAEKRTAPVAPTPAAKPSLAPAPRTQPVVSTAPAVVTPAPAPSASPAAPTVARSAPVAPAASLFEKPAAIPAAPARPCLNLTRDERVAQLKDVAARVAQCTRCEELARTRHQTVFGVGNPEAEIMFIGEAPGADEDRQGEPFVGAAGQLLNKIITASKLTREEIYICNILRCRPPGNRTPAPDEAANCREYLDAQIATINPKYIVCWGSVAAQNLLNITSSIGKLRGKFFDYQGIKVMCTYHPSYLLRTPTAKKDVWEDMKFFRRAQGVELQ